MQTLETQDLLLVPKAKAVLAVWELPTAKKVPISNSTLRFCHWPGLGVPGLRALLSGAAMGHVRVSGTENGAQVQNTRLGFFAPLSGERVWGVQLRL